MKYSADSDQTPAVLDQPSTEKWDRQSLKTRLIPLFWDILNSFHSGYLQTEEMKWRIMWHFIRHFIIKFEPVHEISNNVVCATNKATDQPAHTRSLIRAFTSRLSII